MEDRYKSYTPTQLAGEASFIRWVQHGEKESAWQDWLNTNTEVHPLIDESRRIVQSVSKHPVKALDETAQMELWKRIHHSVLAEQHQPIQRTLHPLWRWGLAATASLALLVWFNTRMYNVNILASAGEKKEIKLPEESIVTINAGSTIEYKDNTFEKNRVLHLDGEAFFNVKPGSTFTVRTDGGTVTVVGTSFNVISRDGRFEVQCYTGKVRVENKNKDQVEITAGEKSIQPKEKKTLIKTTFTSDQMTPGWMSGKFTFENQSLKEVFTELERQYDVRVKLAPGLEDLKYTGLFESGDLEKALSLITWPLHLTSHIEGNTVTISR